MSAGWGDWAFDTLLYTGGLIALVLVLRRPVAKYFGAELAYSLWALPLLRLVLPPITLPAWMAPAPEEPATQYETVAYIIGDLPAAEETPAQSFEFLWQETAIALWLLGAVAFLAWRTYGYLKMRNLLLRDAHEVGREGRIRFVETPDVDAPIAFGVIDKVIALPPGFIMLLDRQRRDFAIAHELAHHRANDLVANFAAQPLLALHWFNPLAWFGWRAMRRDQEAACDARVMNGRAADERAAYGEVIASFATGPRLALAAPMACPVLGEKSIIHRLRSLSMSEISPRRRMMGRSMLAGAALVLPLTASVSYAESLSAEAAVPPVPPVPAVAAVPPVPGVPAVPPAPLAPDAPEAPAPGSFEYEFDYDTDGNATPTKVFVSREAKAKDGKGKNTVHRFVMADGSDWEFVEDEFEARMDAMELELDAREAEWEAALEQHEAALQAIEEAREAGQMARAEALARAEEARAMADAKQMRVKVVNADHASVDGVTVKCGDKDMVQERELSDGRKLVVVCKSAIKRTTLNGLYEARKEVASDKDIPADTRKRVLRSLDRQIEHFERNG